MVAVVTELIVDSSGAKRGVAEYDAAMTKAETAITRQTATMTQSVSKQAQQWQRLATAVNPVLAAQQKLEQAVIKSNAAMAAGVTTQNQVNSTLDAYRARVTAAEAATTGLTRQTGVLTGVMSTLKSMVAGLVLSFVGFTTITRTWRLFIDNSIEAQKTFAQLEARLEATGNAIGFTATQLTDMATGLQRITTFGDEAIIEAETILITFRRIGHDVFPEALKSILDVATAMGTDLPSAARTVGKALDDPVRGMVALRRAGVAFTEEQTKLIKSLVDSGQRMEAQKVILRELEGRFGGAAEAARGTLGGAVTALGEAFGDMFEVSAEGSDKLIASINALTDVLTSPETIAAIQGFGGFLFDSIAQFLRDIETLKSEINSLIDFFSLKNTPLAKSLEGTADTRQVEELRQEMTRLAEASNTALDRIKELTIIFADPTMAEALGIEGLTNDLTVAQKEFRDLAVEYNDTRAAMRDLHDSFIETGEAAEGTGEVIKTLVGDVEELTGIAARAAEAFSFFSGVIGSVQKFFEPLTNVLSDRQKSMEDQIRDAIKAAEDAKREATKSAADQADSIRSVNEALEFETQQLSRSAREQEVYNRLKQAGVDINSAEGQAIAAATRRLFDMTEAQEAATQAQRDLVEEQERAQEVAEDLLETRRAIIEDIAFERETMFLSDEDVEIASRLRDIYGNDIPAALSSWEAEQIRINNALRDAQEIGSEIRDSLAGAISDIFTGEIKSFDDFLDKFTKGIAQAAADALGRNLTDMLFGGKVDVAGSKTASALDVASNRVVAATGPLNNAAANLSTAAGKLQAAAGAASGVGAAVVGGGGGGGLSSIGIGASGIGSSVIGGFSGGGGIVGNVLGALSGTGGSGGIISGISGSGTGATGTATITSGGLRATVAAAYAPAFQGFLNDLAKTGYQINSIGGLSVRNIAGTSTPSFHGVGAAIDINPSLNPVTFGRVVTNLPSNISQIAAKWGLGWGGNWQNKKDAMHFSAAISEGGTFNVNRFGGVPSTASIFTGGGGGANLSIPTVSSSGGVSVPVSVVDAPAPAFSGMGKLLNSPGFAAAISGFSMGYQAQDPLMGGIGGALSGFMSGGLMGGALGGIFGVIGGFLGEAAKKKAELEAAKKAWEDMSEEVEEFSEKLQGIVKGDLRTTFDDAQERFDEIAEAAEKAEEDIGYLVKQMAEFKLEAVEDFSRGFGLVMKSLRSGLGDSDPIVQGAQAISDLRDELLGFIDDAFLAMGPNAARRARQASREFVLTQISGPDELTPVQEELRRLKGASTEALAVLQDLGWTLNKAVRKVARQFREAVADLREEFEADLQERLDVATGKGVWVDIANLVEQASVSFADAEAIGADWTLVAKLFAADAQAIVDSGQIMGSEFDELIKRFPVLSGVVHEFSGTLEDVMREIEEMNRVAQTIVEYVNSLRAGSGSTLSPQARLAAAQGAFNTQLALAQGGNVDAQASITRFADDLIKAAREYHASTAAFQTIFTTVQDQLLALPAVEEATDPVVVALRDLLLGVEEVVEEIDLNGDLVVSELEKLLTADGLTRTTLQNAINAGPQATATLVATALTPNFTMLDTSVDGVIDFNEMKSALGGIATDAQLKVIFNELDFNGNLQISKIETLIAAEGLTRTTLNAAIQAGPSATASLIATALTPNFTMLDTSIDGVIDFNEMKAALGGIATDAQLRAILTELDINGDGVISVLEAQLSSEGLTRAAIQAIPQGTSAAQIATALAPYFDALDTDVNGLLTSAELEAAGLNPTNIALLLRRVDVDQNGVISKEELIRVGVTNTTSAVDDQDAWLKDTADSLRDTVGSVRYWTKQQALLTNTLGAKIVPYYNAYQTQFIAMQRQLSQADGVGYVGVGGGTEGTWPAPGFQHGGLVTGGIPGRDSVPALLTPGEFVLTAQQTAAAFSAANDNRRNFIDMMRVFAEGTNAQIRTLRTGFDRIVARLDNLERRARIEASREPRRVA